MVFFGLQMVALGLHHNRGEIKMNGNFMSFTTLFQMPFIVTPISVSHPKHACFLNGFLGSYDENQPSTYRKDI